MPKFSVKSEVFKSEKSTRASTFDGPWKGTLEEAIKGYADKFNSKFDSSRLIFRPFVAEETPKETAPSGDGKKYYRDRADLQAALEKGLKGHGLKFFEV